MTLILRTVGLTLGFIFMVGAFLGLKLQFTSLDTFLFGLYIFITAIPVTISTTKNKVSV